MSKINLTPNASGTGVFTIASPNSNTDRTLNLPDVDGTVVTSDSNGNVGIGTSSPVFQLDIESATDGIGLQSISSTSEMLFYEANTSKADLTYRHSDAPARTDILEMRTRTGNIAFRPGDSEAMRIDSSGNLLVGTTDSSSATGSVSGIRLLNNGIFTAATSSDAVYISRRTTTGTVVQFRYNTTNIGTISTNGSTTSYNTSSDYRLKENVVSLDNATDRLNQIPVHRFNFIIDPDTTVDGFLAHEVADVVPEAIVGTKDEVDDEGNPVYQGIDQSKLVPLLVAAVQELEARIAALETN